MKKSILMIIAVLVNIAFMTAQSKVFSKDELPTSGEILISSSSDKDYFGTVKNGEVVSAYSKDKLTGKKELIPFNGKSSDGKMVENGGNEKDGLPPGTMAKPVGTDSGPAKNCKKYTQYDCEIIVTRQDGSTFTKMGKCVRQEEVECPAAKAKKNSDAIKASSRTNTKH